MIYHKVIVLPAHRRLKRGRTVAAGTPATTHKKERVTKMNERKATLYDLKRMCNSSLQCIECPIKFCHNTTTYLVNNIDKVNDIILKWCDEHPEKTYADDFFEKFPNAERRYDYEIPNVCINRIYPNVECDCDHKTCGACWHKPYKEDTE